MLLLRKPSPDAIGRFLDSQRDESFSYPEVGASRTTPPSGYLVDHNRVRLGGGRDGFTLAVEALRSWRMFRLGWLEICWPDAPIAVGATVAVLVRHFALWSLNACRIVYVVAEDGPIERYGFAYGTLAEHGERGEERFTVEWRHDDDSVWYDLFAFSRPNQLAARLGYPLARRLQKRFARDSKRAMLEAVQGAFVLS